VRVGKAVNITVIAVGKIKEKYLKDGLAEYSKRLGRYCKLDIIEVPDEKAPENMSAKEMRTVKIKEGESLERHLKDGAYKIALCIDGTMMASEELSNKISSLGTGGVSSIDFIIGGSLGLSDDIVKKCDFKLSFSKMTFPHQLMRLILLEQIYRSFKIISNETYHK
jgi:rRNA large subunit m3Psi methyltransferase RlmH